MFDYIVRFLKLFHRKTQPFSLALASFFGLFIAFTPTNIVIDTLSWILAYFLGLPFVVVSISVAAGIILSIVLDPLCVALGELFLVKFTFLEPFWTFFFKLPFVFLLELNHTLMLGVVLLMFFLFVPYLKIMTCLFSKLATVLVKYKVLKSVKDH